MYKGSCLCGAINITLDGPITDIIHCHCSLCRKNSGTTCATNGFINAADFKVSDPENAMTFFEFKPGKKRHFCSRCGSPVYSSNDEKPDKYRIRLGIFDSDIDERPMSHNFMGSKANWEDLDADLPRYEEFEPSRQKT